VTRPARTRGVGAAPALLPLRAQNFSGFTILDAMDHESLWRPWFRDPSTWQSWRIFLKAVFGLRLARGELAVYRKHTGRKAPPAGGANEAWLVCGRRSGKSFTLALITCYLVCFKDWSQYLSPGERGVVMVLAADKRQARIIFRYARALLLQVPALAALVERETAEAIDLVSGISLEILAASHKTTRGYTVLAALIDEIAFLDTNEAGANPDEEVLAAIRPSMSTIPGAMLLCASSPHGKVGALWKTYKRFYGQDDAVFVWHAATRDMNRLVKQETVDKALSLDEPKARAEFFAEFRDDTGQLLSSEVVEAAMDDIAVRPGRPEFQYFVYGDAASGVAGGDAFSISVSHVEGDLIVIDLAFERPPPFDPVSVLKEVRAILTPYRLGAGPLVGDHHGANWLVSACAKLGITYQAATRDTSTVFLEALPLFSSGRIRLPKNDRLVRQLCALERKTTGGRDRVEHPRGGGLFHGDLAVAVCGAAVLAAQQPDVFVPTMPIILSGAVPDPWSPNWHGGAPPFDPFDPSQGSLGDGGDYEIGTSRWMRQRLAERDNDRKTSE
jgi:hypothetical protein